MVAESAMAVATGFRKASLARIALVYADLVSDAEADPADTPGMEGLSLSVARLV